MMHFIEQFFGDAVKDKSASCPIYVMVRHCKDLCAVNK